MLGVSSRNTFDVLESQPLRRPTSRGRSRSDVYGSDTSGLSVPSRLWSDTSTESRPRGRSRDMAVPSRPRAQSWSRNEAVPAPRARSQSRTRDEVAAPPRSRSLSRSRGDTTQSTQSQVRPRSMSRHDSGVGLSSYGYEGPGTSYEHPAPSETPWKTVTSKALQRVRSLSVASSRSARSNASSGIDSYYSCEGLPNNDPARRIKASEARRQVQQAPPTPPRPTGYARTSGGGGGYPHTFWNKEKLGFQAQGTLTEYPVFPSGNWSSGTPPGAARGVYNERSRAAVDVMYHDPRKPGAFGRSDSFSVANYRPRSKVMGRGSLAQRYNV